MEKSEVAKFASSLTLTSVATINLSGIRKEDFPGLWEFVDSVIHGKASDLKTAHALCAVATFCLLMLAIHKGMGDDDLDSLGGCITQSLIDAGYSTHEERKAFLTGILRGTGILRPKPGDEEFPENLMDLFGAPKTTEVN